MQEADRKNRQRMGSNTFNFEDIEISRTTRERSLLGAPDGIEKNGNFCNLKKSC
jgi:hypothetical protein